MAAPAATKVSADVSMKITKIKVKRGQKISKGSLFCLYTTGSKDISRLKSNDNGVVQEIHVKEGEEVDPGYVLFTVEGCSHPTVMKDMCAECGADLRVENSTAGNRKEDVSASVAMVHSIPELIVSEQEAKELGKADEDRLLKTRKLVLLVDLDQTLIHTTNDAIPANLKDVHHFQLWHGNSLLWYHTRLRPQTMVFLQHISELYELHICTFGARLYAHTIARILDPKEKYFSHRILSRDECFNSQAKTANLKALFPCGDSMVCIIDDREDVWHFSPNLVHVKPYRFFQGTADINAPPGLTKTEQDDKPMIHRVRRVSQSSTDSKEGEQTVQKNGELENKGDNQQKSGDLEDKTREDKKVNKDIPSDTGENKDSDKVDSQEKSGTDDTHRKPDSVIQNDKPSKTVEQEMEAENMDTQKDNDAAKSTEAEDEKSTEKTGSELEGESKSSDQKIVTGDSDEKTVGGNTESENTREMSELTKQGSDNKMGENENDNQEEEEDLIEWDDEDDYLFYLEEILKTIHKTFYNFYDHMKEKDSPQKESEKPNLKNIIPYIKKKVLKGCNILFSGVIPTNMSAEKSRAYTVAKALGGNIHQELRSKDNETDKSEYTTHIVAARSGTSKVRSAVKCKHVKIVNPDWLWSCSERWEKVEEILFPLAMDTDEPGRDSPTPTQLLKKRKHESDGERRDKRQKKTDDNGTDSAEMCDDSEQAPGTSSNSKNGSGDAPGKETFSLTYNPIMAFSDDDLAYMDKEVDDEMDEEDDLSSEDEGSRDQRMRSKVLKCQDDLDVSSSDESLTGGVLPRGWGLKKLSPKHSRHSSDEENKGSSSPEQNVSPEYDSETDQDKFDKIMDAFGPETENSDEEEYQESIGSVDDEIADAVMKEFLS